MGISYFEYMAVDVMEHHLRCLADLRQRGKPMGAGLSDKMAGSIISVLLVSVFYYQAAHRATIILQEQTRSNDISLIGSIWALAIFLLSANNMTSEWSTPPGRILTTIYELNMTFFFVISIVFVILGLVLMLIEYFRKDN